MVGASYVSAVSVAVLAGVLCVVAAIGWPHVLGVPAKKSQSAVIGISAVLAVAAAASSAGPDYMVRFPAAVALGVGAILMIQLIRGTGQSLRLESTFGASSGVFAIALGSGWAAADRLTVNSTNSGMMLVTGISILAALAASLLPWPDRLTAPLGLVLAGLAGPLGALLLTDVPALPAAVLGIVCGAMIVCVRRLLMVRDAPLNTLAALSVGLTPVLSVGGIVYFLDKVLFA
nr:hypothetical protein [Arthrobacter sp. Br18]